MNRSIIILHFGPNVILVKINLQHSLWYDLSMVWLEPKTFQFLGQYSIYKVILSISVNINFINNCFFFLLLKAIVKSKWNLIALAFKSKKRKRLMAKMKGNSSHHVHIHTGSIISVSLSRSSVINIVIVVIILIIDIGKTN